MEQIFLHFYEASSVSGHLSVGLSAGLVSLAEVKTQSVTVFLVQALHDVEGAFT